MKANVFARTLIVCLACIAAAAQAAVYNLTPADDWYSVINGEGLQPGDEVILAPGTYVTPDEAMLNIAHVGTADQPIVIRAADDGTAVILAHPGEYRRAAEEAERSGLTVAEAEGQGRFVFCTPCVCRRCGGLYIERAPGRFGGCSEVTGCSAGSLRVAVVAGLAAGLFWQDVRMGIAVGAVAGVFAAQAISSMRERRERRRLDGWPPLSPYRCCPEATPETVAPFAEMGGERFPCRSCGETAVVYTCTGVS
jgi:hypothetical protein